MKKEKTSMKKSLWLLLGVLVCCLSACYKMDRELWHLKEARQEGRVTEVFEAVRSGNHFCRAYAAKMIAEEGRADLLPEVLPLLQDPERQVRWSALDAVAELGTAQEIPALQAVLEKETDAALRRAAVNALILISVPEVVPVLVDLLQDPDKEVMMNAGRGLSLLTGEPFSSDHDTWQAWLEAQGGVVEKVHAQHYRFVPEFPPKRPPTPGQARREKSVPRK